MATTITIDGKRHARTIEQKARQLEVIDIGEPGVLAVRSGSNPRTAYAVQHDGHGHATYCPCDARTERCAHVLAAELRLEAERRDAYTKIFGIYEMYG